MFCECEDEADMTHMHESIPHLVYNDADEWETVPNSNEIPCDEMANGLPPLQPQAHQQQHQHHQPYGQANMPRSVSASLISSISSSIFSLWHKPNSKGNHY